MRFSIRQMLALMFLVALGMLAWRTSDDARRDVARLAQIQNEIKSLQVELRLDRPAIHQMLLRTQDEFQPLHAMREPSMQHFNLLRHKYSTMESRGRDVFSMR